MTDIKAETGITLWPGDGDSGYLDLVLHVRDAQHREAEVWIEVKVDAWESGSQLKNYRRHASRRSPSPIIITLGRMRISDYFPSLTWNDIVSAIDSVPIPHYMWESLRSFLQEERTVRQPLPTELVDSRTLDGFIDTIVEINGRLRDLLTLGTELAWADGTLKRVLPDWFEKEHQLLPSTGPLRFGLAADGGVARWCLRVSAGKNYERVPLDARQMLRDADIGGLSQEWVRHRDRSDVVLERSVPLGGLTTSDEVVSWFDEGFRQLHDAKILKRYLEGLAAKQAKAEERSRRGGP